MRITKVIIKHFRSIKKMELDVSGKCILAGPNSCGKSNVLRAIRFAFVESYIAERVATNFPTFITGPAAEISVRIEFDKPTPSTAGKFALPTGVPFSYEVSVRRNAKAKYSVNGVTISSSDREEFLAELMVVFVPPIRDIASDGLDPLKGLLARALRSAKKGQSIAALNGVVRTALTQKGNEVLQKAGNEFGSIGTIGKVATDALGVDIALAVEQLKLKVKLAGKGDIPLAALGTGHQSQVVMNLFGALGASFHGQVIYMFEEPDNHLHPTALMAVSERMRAVAESSGAQVLVSSHSPAFIGSFQIDDVVFLDCVDGMTVEKKRQGDVSQRRVHALMARFGLKPIEALLARSVVLVEGVSDVSLIRALSRQALGVSPDQRDVLVIPCGGKVQLVELYCELVRLGVNALVVLDGDAALGGSPAYLARKLATAEAASVNAAIATLVGVMSSASKKVRATLASIEKEVASGPPAAQSFSKSPVETVAKASARIDAASLSRASGAFSRGSRRVWGQVLAPAGIWVWKDDPETLLSSIPGAAGTVLAVSTKLGIAPGLSATAPAAAVFGWLHNRASDPVLHEAVIEALAASSPNRSGELWEFIAYLKRALG